MLQRVGGLFLYVLYNGMSDYITHAAASDNANEAWYHEAVVKNVFANLGGAGTVKADTGQI